jgi:predicted DNA-binding transcriptional regulator YafY
MIETALRYIEILKLVPPLPKATTTGEIRSKLAEGGIEVGLRTIQRDLENLSAPFALSSASGKPAKWSCMGDPVQIPALDPHTALTLRIVEQYARRMLPPATVEFLGPHTRAAEALLGSAPGFAAWLDKVRILPRGFALLPPACKPGVQATVYDALLEGKRLRMKYRARASEGPQEYEVNPLGLVLRDQLAYLVCTLWDYSTLKHLVLHRIEEASLFDRAATVPVGFNLDDYIRSGEFGYPESGRMVLLKVLFDAYTAKHLDETPLEEHQTLKPAANGRVMLTARVLDTADLRWWLRAFGSAVEVLAPKSLREEFRVDAKALARIYR